jgi:hypothetical protein
LKHSAAAILSAVIAFPALTLAFGATPQSEGNAPSQSVAETKSTELKFYAQAHPYLDEPLPQLKKHLRYLDGLKAATSQDFLRDLLSKAAASSDELLDKLPNLISDEDVTQTQWADVQKAVPTCVGMSGCVDPVPAAQKSNQFNYIVLAHAGEQHRLLLEEYRTTRENKPVPQMAQPYFQGFAAFWVIFSSSRRMESQFRYLGQQKIDGHATFVVAFAQIPGSVEFPGLIVTREGSVPMLLQGIVWVDQKDFRIVLFHTDLLSPQPEIGYHKQTSDIRFGGVRIPTLKLELWLPKSVLVDTEAEGHLWREQHHYSKFRLYEAKSKIILQP